MKIEIESEVLIAHQISANQYCYMYCKTRFSNAPVIFSLTKEETDDLEDKKFIKNIGDGIALREKAYQLFELSDAEQLWNQFKARYPIKHGERRLHDSQEKCRNKYLALISGKPEVHDKILKGLENEQLAREAAARKREFFPGWKMMSVYLNQQHWNTYVDYEKENDVEERTEGV